MDHKKLNIYYGWWIVGAGFLLTVCIGGFVHFSFTTFFEPLVNTFGWTHTQVSLAASIRGLESGLLAPLVGFLFERWGPRKLMIVGVIIMVIGWQILSSIDNLALFYISYVLITIGASTCMGVTPISTIADWFRKRQGLATGIIVSGTGCGGIMVLLSTHLIDIYGWRMAAMIIGWGLLLITLPLSFFFRRKSKDYHIISSESSTIAHEKLQNPSNGLSKEPDIKISQALRSRAFWFIAIGCMAHIMCMNAVLTHIMPYLSTVNISRNISSLIASFIPVISIIGRIGFGLLGDRFDKRKVTATALLLTGLGVISLNYINISNLWILPIFLLLIGIGYGGPVPMVPTLLTQYFGRNRLAPLLGLALGLSYIGGMIGPPLAGLAYDFIGSYNVAWFILASIIAIGIIMTLSIPKIRRQSI